MSRPVVFNFTRASDRIKPFVFRDRKPLFIYCVGHNFNSYCLNISSNHNFFLGGCQQVLVKNCGIPQKGFGGALIIDDFLKADNYKSAVEKENCIDIYMNTLKSRLNNPETPIIIIAQRLAKDDLIGWIEENEPNDVKMVGNTIKSKKMPGYIEKFLYKGIRLLLKNQGQMST